jgi:hypothetical protein
MTEDQSELSPEMMTDYMESLLGHYLDQHNIILKQLEHAQNATVKSIEDIENICKRFEITKPIKQFDNIHAMNIVWGDVIKLCQNAGLGEKELMVLGQILEHVPRPIRQDYNQLIDNDSELKTMMFKIKSPENIAKREAANNYKNDVHQKVNNFMGVDEDEYDVELPAFSSNQKDKLDKVYKIFRESESCS